ncbi:glycoside hydrolase family 95-like protein [Kitasatospora purpeofusca]|uniref:glycoside hydrolase family 95-like protein n=1 Tax=Kitasatospora purpeofusca TaxID=67352 RepID=UPI0035E0962A
MPPSWPSGDVHGLRARGGLTVDLSWRRGELTAAGLRAARGTTVELHLPERAGNPVLTDEKGNWVTAAEAPGTARRSRIHLPAGSRRRLSFPGP